MKTRITLLALLCSLALFSQNNRQRELQRKKEVIAQQIKNISKLKKEQNKEKKTIIEEIELITHKINAREELLLLTLEQSQEIEVEIEKNKGQIGNLNGDISKIKKEYGQVILQNYKRRNSKNYFLMILSSENLYQGYKRFKYVSHYLKNRKKYIELLKNKESELKQANENLNTQIKEKKLVLDEIEKEKEILSQEKSQQAGIVEKIKKKEKLYNQQIKEKQKQSQIIEDEINRLVKLAIEDANRKKAQIKQRQEKAQREKAEKEAKRQDKISKSRESIEATGKVKEMSSRFEDYKGKLNWPVEKGSKLYGFGIYSDPVFPEIKHNNNGITLLTEPNADALCVFDGEVSRIMIIAGYKTVCVRHGEYMSLYFNLSEVYVNTGNYIKTKTPIGKVFTDEDGVAQIKFVLMKNTTKLNPETWLKNM